MEQDKLEYKPDYASAVSTAMRRPLTDLFSHIRSLAAHEELLTPYLRQELEGVLLSGYRLLRVADSISAAEKYEPAENAMTVFPLWPHLREGLEAARLLLGVSGSTLQYDLPETRETVRADEEMLMRAVLHLISNALDAAEDGTSVTVRGSIVGEQAVIIVSDTGCGIAPDRLDSVFEPYTSLNRDGLPYQSLGLGLPLARRVLETHGGSLRIVSTGEGTAAVCSLPLCNELPALLRSPTPPYLQDTFSPLYTVLCEYITPPWPYSQP